MNPKLHATIMLWSASTNPARLHCEDRANRAFAAWKRDPEDNGWRSNIEHLRDTLNDLVNCGGDYALLYEGEQVVGIKPEMLPDFRAWCERYGFDGGGL